MSHDTKLAKDDDLRTVDSFTFIILQLASRIADPMVPRYPTHGEALTASTRLIAQLTNWDKRCSKDYAKIEYRLVRRGRSDHFAMNRRFMDSRVMMLHTSTLPDQVRLPMQHDYATESSDQPFQHEQYLHGLTLALRRLVQDERIETKELYLRNSPSATPYGPFTHERIIDMMRKGSHATIVTKPELTFEQRMEKYLQRAIRPMSVASKGLKNAATRELAFRYLEGAGIDPCSRNILDLYTPKTAQAVITHAIERRDIILYL